MATNRHHRSNRPRPTTSPAEFLESRVLLSTILFEGIVKYPAGPTGGFFPEGPHLVAVGDFTGDGVNDLLAVGDMPSPLTWEMHYARVLPGLGDGTFGRPLGATPAGDQVSDVVVADFNRDGHLDAAVSNRQSRGQVHVLLGKGDGTFNPALGRGVYSGSNSTGIAVLDWNRDGAPDLMASNADPWSPELSQMPAVHGAALLLNKGDGTFNTARIIPLRGPQHFVESGDVNNDRWADAVFGQVVIGPGDFAAPESRVFAVLGGGLNELRPIAAATTVPAAITGMELADMNSDGRLDVAVSTMTDFMRPGGGGGAGVLPGNGDGTFAAAAIYEVGLPVTSDVAVADFDLDGRRDLAVSGHNPFIMAPIDLGSVAALRNLGRTFGDPTWVSFDGHPAGLAAGQLNRDRLPDLATAIPRQDALGVLMNTTKTITARGARLSAVAGRPFTDQPVAHFTLTGPPSPAAAPAVIGDEVTASILWGDGTRATPGKVVVNSDGTHSVLGSHTYRRAGLYRVVVTLRWADGTVAARVLSLARVTSPTTRTT